jgi:H+/Na+-translocating ferredoxin:NAD+ oxidoreductase subunit A
VTELSLVFIAACLANNLVLDYLLGVSPVFAVSRKIETALGMSVAMLVVLPITSLFSYALDVYILRPLDLQFLQLLAFVLIISLLTLIIEKALEKFRPALHERTAVFFPLLLVNTALLGVALLNIQQSHGLIFSIFFGIGSAAGFGIVVVIFSALRQRIAVADVPLAFQGVSILLITLGILSMAFLGFTGIG